MSAVYSCDFFAQVRLPCEQHYHCQKTECCLTSLTRKVTISINKEKVQLI